MLLRAKVSSGLTRAQGRRQQQRWQEKSVWAAVIGLCCGGRNVTGQTGPAANDAKCRIEGLGGDCTVLVVGAACVLVAIAGCIAAFCVFGQQKKALATGGLPFNADPESSLAASGSSSDADDRVQLRSATPTHTRRDPPTLPRGKARAADALALLGRGPSSAAAEVDDTKEMFAATSSRQHAELPPLLLRQPPELADLNARIAGKKKIRKGGETALAPPPPLGVIAAKLGGGARGIESGT